MVTMGTLPLGRGSSWGGARRLGVRPAHAGGRSTAPLCRLPLVRPRRLFMFRAEVIGSLLRPSYLKEARAAFERGELSLPDLKRVEDRAVDQVIALQEGT